MKKILSKHDPSNTPAQDSITQDTDVKFVDILSYGEIEGLSTLGGRDEGSSAYYNQIRFKNESGSTNIADLSYEVRTGTPDQEAVEGFATDFSEGHPTNFSSLVPVNHKFTQDKKTFQSSSIRTIDQLFRLYITVDDPDAFQGFPQSFSTRQDVSELILYDQDGEPLHGGAEYSRTGGSVVEVYARFANNISGSRADNIYTGSEDLAELMGFPNPNFVQNSVRPDFIGFRRTAEFDEPVTISYGETTAGSTPYKLYIESVDGFDEARFLIRLEDLLSLHQVTRNEQSLSITFSAYLYDGDTSIDDFDRDVNRVSTRRFKDKKSSPVEGFISVGLSGETGAKTIFIIQNEFFPCRTTDSRHNNRVNYGRLYFCIRARLAYYTLLAHHTYNHPNRALVVTSMHADVFAGSLPNRKFIVDGIKMAVPRIGTERYDQSKRGIDPDPLGGIWLGELTDGGMYEHVSTDNPAWIVYNLVTNPDYGLGLKMNKTSVKVASDYCDQIIQLPNGQTEPRFRFNHQIIKQGKAESILNNILGTFQAKLTQFNGEFHLEVDRPLVGDDANLQDRMDDPDDTVTIIESDDLRSSIVTNDNVIGGEFTYSYKSIDEVRTTVILVSWINPEMDYNVDVVQVEADPAVIDTYGRNTKKVVAMGCQSRFQAQRLGRWHLSSILYEQEAVTYSAGIDHITSHTNKIIYVRDDRRGDIDDQIQARFVSQSGTNVTINKEITVDLNQRILLKGYQNHDFKEDDQGEIEVEVSQEFTVTNNGDVTADLELSEEPAFTVADNSVCIAYTRDSRPIPYRIVDISKSGESQFNVSAIRYDADRYAYIDDTHISIHQTLHVGYDTKPHAPGNLRAIPVAVTFNPTTNTVHVAVAWTASRADARISHYDVQWKLDGVVDWQTATRTNSTQVDVPELSTNRDVYYRFRVRAVTYRGDTSVWNTSRSRPIRGWVLAPRTPSSVGYHILHSTMELNWEALPDYGLSRVEIRYSATEETWDEAQPHDEQRVFFGNEGITTTTKAGYFYIRLYNIFEQRSDYVTINISSTELAELSEDPVTYSYPETNFHGVDEDGVVDPDYVLDENLVRNLELDTRTITNDDDTTEDINVLVDSGDAASSFYQFSTDGTAETGTLDLGSSKVVTLDHTVTPLEGSSTFGIFARPRYRVSSSTDDDFEFSDESWLLYTAGRQLTGRFFQFGISFTFLFSGTRLRIRSLNLEVRELEAAEIV